MIFLSYLQVNTQTSVMVKKANDAELELVSLHWAWMAENLDKTVVHGKGQVSAKQLLDQKFMNDSSDYLWYMTRYICVIFIIIM